MMTKINSINLWGIVLLIFRLLLSPDILVSQDLNVQEFITEAKRNTNQFQFDTAVMYYDSAIQAAVFTDNKSLEAYLLRLKGRVYILASQNDSALVTLEKAVKISKKVNDDSTLAMAYLNIAYILKDRGTPDSAMNLYNESLRLYELQNDSIGMAKVYTMLAIHYKYSGDFDLGLKNALMANFIFRKQNKMSSSLGRSYINLGNIYEKLGDYDTAASCFEHAYQVGQTINNVDISQTSLFNRAVMYWHKGNEEIEQGDSAKAFKSYQLTKDEFLKAVEFSKSINDRKTLAMLYSNMSALYKDLGMYDQAISFAKESIKISSETNIMTDHLNALNNLGNAYKAKKQYQKAEEAYLESLKLARISKQKEAIEKAAVNLMTLYEITGEYKKALEYAKLGEAYKDSIFNEVKLREIEKHKTNFEILHLKDQNEIKELDKKRIRAERNATLGVGISLVILLIGILIFFRMRARKNRIIAEQRIQKLEDEKKLMAARAVLVGQEKERERIARELHDGIGVLLSTASIHFSSAEEKADKKTVDLLKKANQLLKDAGKEVRQISHNMMPGVLSKFGLSEAIEDLFEEVEQADHIKVELSLTCGDERLVENMEIMIYRVIQEMLNNTLKHANATVISLHISRDENEFFIDYSDDGIGFEEDKIQEGRNFGLSGIRSRVEYLGGKIKLISQPGKGVHYSIEIPLSESIK